MLTLKEWMELGEYRITEGSTFDWHCYGPNAYQLDSWNGDHNGYSFCVIFDTKDQTVYEVQAHDYKNNRAYRMINSAYLSKLTEESAERDCQRDEAWEDVNYIDLEVDDDFIEKCIAIREGEDYDTSVSIPLNLNKESLHQLMLLAHENDMTLNQYVEKILRIEMGMD